jgi:hypothetical protein
VERRFLPDEMPKETEMKANFVAAAGSVALAIALAAPAVAADQHQDQSNPAQGSELPTMRVDQLKGKKVVNEQGGEIGDVDEVVRNKATKKVFAVVEVGGFLGIVGTHDVAIALTDLTLRNDQRIAAPPGTTKDKLEKMPEYKEADYDKLGDDEVVTVGARTGSGSGSR